MLISSQYRPNSCVEVLAPLTDINQAKPHGYNSISWHQEPLAELASFDLHFSGLEFYCLTKECRANLKHVSQGKLGQHEIFLSLLHFYYSSTAKSIVADQFS